MIYTMNGFMKYTSNCSFLFMKGGHGMRLIDADKLIELMIRDRNYAEKNGFMDMFYERQHLIGVIKKQPTVYNVDNVIVQLKRRYGIVSSCSIDYAEGLKDAYERAINIVRLEINKEGD